MPAHQEKCKEGAIRTKTQEITVYVRTRARALKFHRKGAKKHKVQRRRAGLQSRQIY